MFADVSVNDLGHTYYTESRLKRVRLERTPDFYEQIY